MTDAAETKPSLYITVEFNKNYKSPGSPLNDKPLKLSVSDAFCLNPLGSPSIVEEFDKLGDEYGKKSEGDAAVARGFVGVHHFGLYVRDKETLGQVLNRMGRKFTLQSMDHLLKDGNIVHPGRPIIEKYADEILGSLHQSVQQERKSGAVAAVGK